MKVLFSFIVALIACFISAQAISGGWKRISCKDQYGRVAHFQYVTADETPLTKLKVNAPVSVFGEIVEGNRSVRTVRNGSLVRLASDKWVIKDVKFGVSLAQAKGKILVKKMVFRDQYQSYIYNRCVFKP